MIVEQYARPSHMQNNEVLREIPSGVSVFDVIIASSNIIATDGIPLASDRANPAQNVDSSGNPINYEYRPYDAPTHPLNESPSRFPDGKAHPLPISGLEEKRFHEHYRAMLQIMTQVREAYIQQSSDQDINRQLTAGEMRDVLSGLMFLPHYILLRSEGTLFTGGKFHPAITILSNASSGSIGAVSGWVDYQKQNGISQELALQMIPDEHIMLAKAEEKKGMIGKKTICPIRPPRQRRFLSSVRDGITIAASPRGNIDITTALDLSEIPVLVKFGRAAYDAKETYDLFSDLDAYLSKKVPKDFTKKRYRQVKQDVSNFLHSARTVSLDLSRYQMQINKALHRSIEVAVHADPFETAGFSMPKITKDLKNQDNGRGLFYPIQPKQRAVK